MPDQATSRQVGDGLPNLSRKLNRVGFWSHIAIPSHSQRFDLIPYQRSLKKHIALYAPVQEASSSIEGVLGANF
jgi:hypothetical protein